MYSREILTDLGWRSKQHLVDLGAYLHHSIKLDAGERGHGIPTQLHSTTEHA